MKTLIIVLVLFFVFCVVLLYACILTSADADRRAEEMHQEYLHYKREKKKK